MLSPEDTRNVRKEQDAGSGSAWPELDEGGLKTGPFTPRQSSATKLSSRAPHQAVARRLSGWQFSHPRAVIKLGQDWVAAEGGKFQGVEGS